MKTAKQVEKILKSLIPNYFLDIKVEQTKRGGRHLRNIYTISAIDEINKQTAEEFKIEPRRRIWFCFWKLDKKWHISLDGGYAYDYLSYESEFGQNKEMLEKLYSLLNTRDLDWNNHYSFNIN
jgi:hypothetical protein